MIVELSFILAFAIHLGHLLEGIKHGLHNLVVCSVHVHADFQSIATDKLRLHSSYVYGEPLNERSNTSPLLAGKFSLFDILHLLSLSLESISATLNEAKTEREIYNMPIELTFESNVLLAEKVDQKLVISVIMVGHETLEGSNKSYDLPTRTNFVSRTEGERT